MFNGKKILAVIPARGGSKGIPYKNIVDAGGKPLIAWTIQEAKKSKYIDKLILSSEDAKIIETALKYGCEVPFVRPAELSKDETPGVDPVLHALNFFNGQYDYIVLLQPTSPLRTAEDIDKCIENCIVNRSNSCVSVKEAKEHPYLMYTIENKLLSPFIKEKKKVDRRQDLPPVYILNGAVYVTNCEWLLINKKFVDENTIAYLMPAERSIDIDTKDDLKFMEYLLGLKK